MSQPDTELAMNPGEEDIGDIAGAMDDGGEEDITSRDEPEGDDPEQDDESGHEEEADDEEGYTFELDGKPVTVKRKDLPQIYRNQMLEADYRQKTAQVAEQRRMVEQHAQQIAQERQQAASQLDVFIGALHQELVGAQPDQSLIESDPQEYLRQTALHNQRAQAYQQALQQRQALAGRMSADQQRQQAEYRQAESARLVEALPAWRDTQVRERESAEIAGYLSDLGYTPQEMNELVDHRALLVARDAAKYRQLQAAKAKQKQPEPPRTVRPGAAATGGRDSSRAKVAADRVRRDPNSLDALASFADSRGI